MGDLLARGVRITSQRRILINLIQNASEYLDALTLLQMARKQDPEIHRATVYRTLALLKDLGLADELSLIHIHGEKNLSEGKAQSDHCRLSCFRCGSLVEYMTAALETLKMEITRESGFEIGMVHLQIGGLCERCAKGSSAPQSPKKSAKPGSSSARK